MRKIKRVMGCILVLVCVTSAISGCGNLIGKTNESTSAKTETDETADKEDKDNQETDDKATEDNKNESNETEKATEDADNKELISVSTSPISYYKYDDTGYNELYKINIQKLYINSNTEFQGTMIMKEDVPDLSKALDKYNEQEEQFASDCEKDFQNYTSDGVESGYEYITDLYVQRADRHVLSILEEFYEYSGGAHGMSGSVGYNYDTETGKELVLSDVVSDTKLLSNILHDKIVSQHKDELLDDPKATIDSMIAEGSLSWTIGYDRIICYFLQYSIAPYSSGTITVELPFVDYPKLINSKYLDVPESYAVELPLQTEDHFDLDGDDHDEVIMPSYDIGEYGDTSALWVSVDGQKASVDCESYATRVTLIHMSDGNNYLYTESSEIDDYHDIYIFELSKNPRYIDHTGGLSTMSYVLDETQYLSTAITDPANLELETYSDIVGTHSVFKTFHIDADGMPVSDETEYKYGGTPFQITSKIPVLMTDESGEEVTLPAGTVFDVLYTDNVDKVGLKSGSKTYVLTFDQIKDPDYDYWRLEIDGKTVSDVFDGIMYAG